MLLISGCQSLAPGESSVLSSVTEELPGQPPESITRRPVTAPVIDQQPEPPHDLWQRIQRELSWQDIDNDKVAKARKYYLRQHNYLPKVSRAAALYLYYIVEEVQARKLPIELALLPLVESTLDPFAYSHKRAAGMWQIMPATGRHLGLQQDWWFDGRRAVRDSTHAALDYLESLNQGFNGDWMLALAAYNSGKSRVRRAQAANRRKGLATDYWSLKLPRETRDYVPRLLALSQIVANPGEYGVEMPHVANAPAFEVVETGGQIELVRAAELAEVSLETLRALNPGQLRWATAPDRPPELLLPVGSGERFAESVAQLSPEDRVSWQHYTIRPGDSLSGIAKKFNVEVALLREANGIRGSLIHSGKTLMIPAGGAWSSSLAMASNTDQPSALGYRVRRGDSLYLIAGKFNISVKDIVNWNSLDPSRYLQPGQKLTLYVSSL
jgi:membrane-bound lytic murein transglycosylase D